MNRFLSLRSAGVLLVAVVVLALPVRASAQVPNYMLRGTAQFVNANDFVGTGNATHLGLYTERGSATFSPTLDPNVLQVDGFAIFTSANGDQLREVINGLLDRRTGAITATVQFKGGTGRFVGATGSATLTGQLLPGGAVSVTVVGTISY